MDGVKQQDSTPQTDSILGFKWIKKITQNIVQIEQLRHDQVDGIFPVLKITLP
jgi:hypothetical protein